MENSIKCVLFDWGNTLMRDFPNYPGPMHAWPKVETMPYAEETLTRISPSRLICLATNATDSTEEEIRQALDRTSLSRMIDKIYCFRKIGYLKPSRDFFDFIFRDLHIDPGEIVMVGDDFERDVQGSAGSGIYSYWLNIQNSQRRIGRLYDTIYSLLDLPQALMRREIALKEQASL